MRSFQKKLTATAAAAALLAALGAAVAQSTDPLDAHSATADRNAEVSQGTRTRTINGADMSANGPMSTPSTQSSTTQSTDTSSTATTTTTAPSSDLSTTNSAPATTDNSAAANTTDNSAAATTPAPRSDRN
jgi:hypothetical protein